MENERDGFIEKLKKLVELGNSKKGILEVEEINDFFKNENLSLEQLEFIYQYLEDNKIDVLRIMDADALVDDDLLLDKDDDIFMEEIIYCL